jgi:hypothetical protein
MVRARTSWMVCDDSKFADIIIHHFCRNDGNDSNDGMVIGAAWLKQLYGTCWIYGGY